MIRNRTEKEQQRLKGVNIAANDNELQLGDFTRLENWIPGDVYSLKKKRGVEAFESDPLTPDPLTVVCGTCPADTIPEPQELGWDECYDYATSNTRGQFHVIPTPAPGVDALATIGDATGFHGAYPRATWHVLRVLGSDDITEVTPVPLPAGDTFTHSIQVVQAGTSGHTDALGYLLIGTYTPFGQGSESAYVWFDWAAQTVYGMTADALTFITGKWAKRGNEMYRVEGDGPRLYRWDMSAAQFSNPAATRSDFTASNPTDVFRTANKLWLIDRAGTLFELNPTTLATVTSYATGIDPGDGIIGLYAASDTLFYILHQGSSIANSRISIFELPSETLTLIDEFHGGSCPNVSINGSNPVQHQFEFASGYFYINEGGSTGNTSAGRTGPLLCPNSEETIIGGTDDA